MQQHIDSDVVEQPPSGEVGPASGRDQSTGRFTTGNSFALVVGHRSAAFWSAREEARQTLVESLIADAGHDVADAPKALHVAADGLAQAVLLRDSAFARLVESGGPLTATGRT